MLHARLATAAVAIPLLLLIILYPAHWPFAPWPLAVLVVAVGIVGMGEYATMAFPTRRAERALTIVLGTALVVGSAVRIDHVMDATLAGTIVVGLVWTLFGRPDFEDGLRDLGITLVGILYVGFLLPHFIWLHQVPDMGPRWIIFVLVIGMAGDTGGYFVGHAIGRHKLMPRVSPGKTVEGALGIVAASLLGGSIAKLVCLPEVGWRELLVLSAAMAILGQLGDLSESIMKRTFGVKESGWLFPGHGGVLDRIDSLLFPVAFLYYHVTLFR